MFSSLLLAAAMLTADPVSSPSADPLLPICVVTSINNQAVPGADPGVLTELVVHEGMVVTKGMKMGAVDDSEARATLDVKKFESDVAELTANSDVDLKYARAAAEVAKVAWEQLKEANKTLPGTHAKLDVLKAELEYKKMSLATEQAEEKDKSNKLTAKAKKAELLAAQAAYDRRVLRAPFDGIIEKVSKRPGEWVAAGEPVVQIVGIKQLRVMGNVDASQWGPADIADRKVSVEVTLPRGKTIKLPGRVIYVSPIVASGRLPVTAEIETPMENGQPVVMAGQKAAMTIYSSQPKIAAEPVVRRTAVTTTERAPTENPANAEADFTLPSERPASATPASATTRKVEPLKTSPPAKSTPPAAGKPGALPRQVPATKGKN